VQTAGAAQPAPIAVLVASLVLDPAHLLALELPKRCQKMENVPPTAELALAPRLVIVAAGTAIVAHQTTIAAEAARLVLALANLPKTRLQALRLRQLRPHWERLRLRQQSRLALLPAAPPKPLLLHRLCLLRILAARRLAAP